MQQLLVSQSCDYLSDPSLRISQFITIAIDIFFVLTDLFKEAGGKADDICEYRLLW